MTRWALGLAIASSVVACQVFLDLNTAPDAPDAPSDSGADAAHPGPAEAAATDGAGPVDAPFVLDAAVLDDVAAWFSFDNASLRDRSPGQWTNVGTPSGYSFTQDAVLGQALEGSPVFDGIHYGDILDVARDSFTLAAWIRHDVVTVEHYSPIVAKGADISSTEVHTPGYAFGLVFNGGLAHIRAAFADGSHNVQVDVSCPGIVNGDYHFVVVSNDRAIGNGDFPYVQVWVDGALEFSAHIDAGQGDAGQPVPIGSLSPSPSSEFNRATFSIGNYRPHPSQQSFWGKMDEVMVFRRSLKHGEIRSIIAAYGRAPVSQPCK